MRYLMALLVILALAGCSRPLTERETAFADALFGDRIDLTGVTISRGLGPGTSVPTVARQVRLVQGTDRACVRTPSAERPPADLPRAFALFERMHFDSGLYASDTATGWPHALRVPQALLLAHELTHVWQWQHRRVTGYTPLRAVAESVVNVDPYYSGSGEAPEFFSYGYEQQAAIVEDWVCFTVANPGHPRRLELRALLEPVLPVARFEAAIQR